MSILCYIIGMIVHQFECNMASDSLYVILPQRISEFSIPADWAH